MPSVCQRRPATVQEAAPQETQGEPRVLRGEHPVRGREPEDREP